MGFELGHAGRHTAILHSSEYNSVLVKANILDAIEDPEYFTRIVQTYSLPGEKAIIFMDVNSTIICNDSVQSKDLSASLLSTMFELMELSPKVAFDFGWGSCPPVSVLKKQSLKKLVKDITTNDSDAYGSFFSEATCRSFFSQLAAFASGGQMLSTHLEWRSSSACSRSTGARSPEASMAMASRRAGSTASTPSARSMR